MPAFFQLSPSLPRRTALSILAAAAASPGVAQPADISLPLERYWAVK